MIDRSRGIYSLDEAIVHSKEGMILRWYGKSDIGKNREDNQDAFAARLIDSANAVFLVCDGVGGAKGGGLASRLISDGFSDSAARMLTERLLEKDSGRITETAAREILLRSLEEAKEALCEKARSDESLRSMSTTLVALLLTDSYAYILNIGDSRAYLHTADGLLRLTKDHSYVQGLVDSGVLSADDAADSAYRNVITRSVGLSADSTPDLYKIALADLGEYTFLLCTDGLTGMVSDGEIGKILSGPGSAKVKAERMIRMANKGGGLDNITALLVCAKS